MRLTMTAAVTGALAAAAGWLYQLAGERWDERRYPPPGRMISIGSHRLHVLQSGSGGREPAVLILPALGTSALEWRKVLNALPVDIAVYVVDRGGIGWSDPGSWLRTPLPLAREATRLLDALQLSSVVLVGHSYGGIVARTCAALNPGRVTGLLLVDSSHEHQLRHLPAADPNIHASEMWRDAARWQLRPLGWRRAWYDLTFRRALLRVAANEVGEDLAPAAVSRELTRVRRRAVVGEMVGLGLAPHVTPSWSRRLGDLPTAVLTVGSGNGWGPAYPTWLQLQQSFLRMSSRSWHTVVADTGHHMNHDVPDVVAAAITDLVAQAGDRATDPAPGQGAHLLD